MLVKASKSSERERRVKRRERDSMPDSAYRLSIGEERNAPNANRRPL